MAGARLVPECDVPIVWGSGESLTPKLCVATMMTVMMMMVMTMMMVAVKTMMVMMMMMVMTMMKMFVVTTWPGIKSPAGGSLLE